MLYEQSVGRSRSKDHIYREVNISSCQFEEKVKNPSMANGRRGHEIQISLFPAIFTEYLTALLVEQECFSAWFCVKVILSKDYTKLIYIKCSAF